MWDNINAEQLLKDKLSNLDKQPLLTTSLEIIFSDFWF